MKDMMLGQMMSMFGSVLPKAEEPKNPVAEFLSGEIRKLYPEQNEITGMIEGAIVDMANTDEAAALRVLLTLYNDIGEFYQAMERERIIDNNPPVEDE
jgi:hypothetical protein